MIVFHFYFQDKSASFCVYLASKAKNTRGSKVCSQ